MLPRMRSYAAPLSIAFAFAQVGAAPCLLGCAETTGNSSGTAQNTGSERELIIPVAHGARTFIELSTPSLVTPEGDGKNSAAWDLAFEGYDIYTNSGLSGTGLGGALGPYAPDIFESGIDPASPIITHDSIGGAFLRWYAYDYENPAHALFSRFHVFGVKDGPRIWKVQILSYYGEQNGAPLSAFYRLRYAELKESGPLKSVELSNIDGTAGGPSGSENSPSGCLDFDTQGITQLSPPEIAASSAWHLCFRREIISVNGELGGPRGIAAADIQGAKTPFEGVADVSNKTAESELPAFEAASYADLNAPALKYRGDRVVSIFSDQWHNAAANPPEPIPASWVVVSAGGQKRYIVTFVRFEGAGENTPNQIVMRVKAVINQ